MGPLDTEFCPCGSGLEFQFCCQKIYPFILASVLYLRDESYDLALEALDRAEDIDPGNCEIQGRRYIIYSLMGKQKEANDSIHKAFQLNPSYPRGHYLLGMDLIRESQFDKALREFVIAAQNYPAKDKYHLNETLINIGFCHYRLGDIRSAKRAWQKAVELLPEDQVARENLIQFIYEDENLAESLKKRDSFFKKYFNNPEAQKRIKIFRLMQKAERTYDEKNYRRAKAYYLAVLEVDETNVWAWYNLGMIALQQGKLRRSHSYLSRYLDLEEDEERISNIGALLLHLESEIASSMGESEVNNNRQGLIFSRVVFHTLEYEQVVERLQEARLFVTEEKGRDHLHMIWFDRPSQFQEEEGDGRILGILTVVRHKLYLECLTAEDLKRGKILIKQILGDQLEAGHQELFRFPHNFGLERSDKRLIPSRNHYKLQRKNLMKYYETRWIYEPIPLLGYLTPLEAMETDYSRKKLIALIRYMELGQRRISKNYSYNFNALRRILGLRVMRSQ